MDHPISKMEHSFGPAKLAVSIIVIKSLSESV